MYVRVCACARIYIHNWQNSFLKQVPLKVTSRPNKIEMISKSRTELSKSTSNLAPKTELKTQINLNQIKPNPKFPSKLLLFVKEAYWTKQ